MTPYVERAEATSAGVNWEVRSGTPARFHHISHGTLGIVGALAAVGAAATRPDLIELALAGAADVMSRNEAVDDGFLVPHSDPQHRPELIERYSYGWCHGPAGDAQVFRLLAAVTGDRQWMDLTRSMLVDGDAFWSAPARCVLAFGTTVVAVVEPRACSRSRAIATLNAHEGLDFARVLVDDLCTRATLDADGARWSNFEHRATPSDLEPRTGWAMGNAGIIRELLRFIRMVDGVPGLLRPVAGSAAHRPANALGRTGSR